MTLWNGKKFIAHLLINNNLISKQKQTLCNVLISSSLPENTNILCYVKLSAKLRMGAAQKLNNRVPILSLSILNSSTTEPHSWPQSTSGSTRTDFCMIFARTNRLCSTSGMSSSFEDGAENGHQLAEQVFGKIAIGGHISIDLTQWSQFSGLSSLKLRLSWAMFWIFCCEF